MGLFAAGGFFADFGLLVFALTALLGFDGALAGFGWLGLFAAGGFFADFGFLVFALTALLGFSSALAGFGWLSLSGLRDFPAGFWIGGFLDFADILPLRLRRFGFDLGGRGLALLAQPGDFFLTFF